VKNIKIWLNLFLLSVLGTGIVPPNNEGIATPFYNQGDDGNNPAKEGVTNSASFRPGEKRAMRGAGTCGSIGTAMASARNPAITASAESKRKRNNLR